MRRIRLSVSCTHLPHIFVYYLHITNGDMQTALYQLMLTSIVLRIFCNYFFDPVNFSLILYYILNFRVIIRNMKRFLLHSLFSLSPTVKANHLKLQLSIEIFLCITGVNISVRFVKNLRGSDWAFHSKAYSFLLFQRVNSDFLFDLSAALSSISSQLKLLFSSSI